MKDFNTRFRALVNNFLGSDFGPVCFSRQSKTCVTQQQTAALDNLEFFSIFFPLSLHSLNPLSASLIRVVLVPLQL